MKKTVASERVMNEKELVNYLTSEINRCHIVAIDYHTNVEGMNKKLVGGKGNEFYGRLSCIKTLDSLNFYADYEKGVNRRTEEEFKAESINGEWLALNKVIWNNGKVYIRFYRTKKTDSNTTFYLDGVQVTDKDTISRIWKGIRQSGGSKRQEAVGIAKEDQMKPFNLCMENLDRICIDHNCIKVAHS
jgi:hypothetical protein